MYLIHVLTTYNYLFFLFSIYFIYNRDYNKIILLLTTFFLAFLKFAFLFIIAFFIFFYK
jgi:hypothetical protein